MINKEHLDYLCNKYNINYNLFETTNTIIIDAKLDKWVVEYYEDIQQKLNRLYKKKSEIESRLLFTNIDHTIKKKLLYDYERIKQKIKITKPYHLLHENNLDKKFRTHSQGWKRNLYQVIHSIVTHKKVIYGIQSGLPYIHKSDIKFNKYNIDKYANK